MSPLQLAKFIHPFSWISLSETWFSSSCSSSIVRYFLEQALGDDELYLKDELADDGDRTIANAKIHAHKVRQELYNEYMELLTQTLDKEDVRSKLLRTGGNL